MGKTRREWWIIINKVTMNKDNTMGFCGEIEDVKLVLFTDDGKYGLKDKNETVVIPANYDEIKYSDYIVRVWRLRIGKKWGVVNERGEWMFPVEYECICVDAPNVYRVRKDGVFGIIDKDSNVLFPFKYKDLGDFDKDGIAYAENEECLYGYVDKEDHVIIPFVYDQVKNFDGDYAIVSKGLGEKGVIDRKGDVVVPLKYNFVYIRCDDIIEVRKIVEGKQFRGLYDLRNGFMLPCIYKMIECKGWDDEGILECDCWKHDHYVPVVVRVDTKKIVIETIDIRKANNEEFVKYLLDCFEDDEELCESVEKYPDRITVLDKSCSCGGYVIKMFYRSSPDSWRNLAGREGWLTICTKCRYQYDFICTLMN